MPRIDKYNIKWPDGWSHLDIEFEAIRRGGKWTIGGQECGLGLFEHFMAARRLLWPDRYRHAWTDLMYHNFIDNDITMLVGCASSQKTSHASEYVLIRYWTEPYDTFVAVSTIDVDKLNTGIFGEIKMLWNAGKERYPHLAGFLIDHKNCIATDNIEEGVRDMRRAILGRACFTGHKWVGLGKLAGTKQKNVIYVCDEIQWMAESFIESWPNLFSNKRVKIIGSGNPKHDPDDQLGIAAEPEDGWNAHPIPQATEVWKTRFMNGKCVNLVGTDSPNFHTPGEPYEGLISPSFAERIAHDWGMDSPKYDTQVRGVMRVDLSSNRVITRQICRDHHAHDKAIWKGGGLTRVLGLDPSYGGQDDCVEVILEWGLDPQDHVVIRVVAVKRIELNVRIPKPVEDQIADQVAKDLELFNVPVQNAFYDPYGKGTIGFSFGRRFGSVAPIPLDSGGKPTERPVRHDLYVVEKDGRKRLMKCSEHYSKFVSETWFSVRYTIESDQLRELPNDVMLEGCARTYDTVAGNKIEIESKDDLKDRVGHSPNKFDALAIALDGARRRGFQIRRLGSSNDIEGDDGLDWLADKVKNHERLLKSKTLVIR